jgi:rhomboid protease GluP
MHSIKLPNGRAGTRLLCLSWLRAHDLLVRVSFRLQKTWFTRKPNPGALPLTLVFTLLLSGGSFLFSTSTFGAREWMPATGRLVFQEAEIWRLWTTLLAHGDFGHLAANALLFIPLTYLLAGYFGPLLFPLLALFSGGITCLLVLRTMPPEVSLIGISGVVSWMGGAWLTLFLLLERRHKLSRRFGAVLFLSLFLLVPETFKPQVSYLSHFTGYGLGAITAGLYFLLNRSKLRSAEEYFPVLEEDLIEEDEWKQDEPL